MKADNKPHFGIVRGQSGFTLIEAMILGAMLSVMILAFSTWSFQRAKQLKARNEANQLNATQNAIKSAATQSESLSQSEELMFDPTLPTPVPSP